MFNEWFQQMRAALPNASIALQAPMAQYTTFRIGGPADALFTPGDASELATALRLADQTDTPVLILGNGSNLLVLDGGIRGVVIHLGSEMSAIQFHGGKMQVGAGATLRAAALKATEAGLGDLTPLSGIPGTVGGAAVMNAGAYGGEMSHVVTRVLALTRAGESRTLTGSELSYRYRGSALMDQGLIATDIEFSLKEMDPDLLRAQMNDYTRRRQEKQPLSEPSAGSFFKRPTGDYASRLIEAAGLKGFTMGDVQVSPKHAGFVINRGHATAAQVLALMREVQKRVQDQSGIMLEPEVKIIGEDAT